MQLTSGSFGRHGDLSTSYCRKAVFSIIVLSLITLSIYGNSFDCSWHFDDKPNITDNSNLHLRELSWDSIKQALFSDPRKPGILYRPIACLSLALNYYFGGLDVSGYHLVNIFIHILSSFFLFLFLYHTLNIPSLKTKYASKSYSIAILATLLWAINPIHTQAITFIVQRMASLAGMFYIMAMYLYLRARTAEKRGKSALFLILCLISFTMAFGSKENAALLPLSIFLYEILIIQGDTGIYLRRNIKGFLVVFGAVLFIGLAYLYYRNGNALSFMAGYEQRPFSITQRLLTEPRIIIFYVSLLIYPVPNRLSVAHSIGISSSLFNPISTLISILFIVGSIGFLIYMARKYPLFSFCFLFFFLNHMIESTIFPLELIFEHRNYIPSMLFFVPVVIGFSNLLEKYAVKRGMKYTISVFIVLLLMSLGHSTFMRNFAWKNEKSLWIDAVEKAPDHFRVHHNLGLYYQDHGYREEAISEYEKALNSPVIHRKNEVIITYYNLGRLYDELKDYEKAEYFYQRAVRMKPDFSPALINLASICDKRGKIISADHYLMKAIKTNPGDPSINFNMGLYFLRAGRPEKAIYHLKKSMNDKRLKKRALLHLGIAYKQKGLFGRAVTCFRESAALDARNITPHLHLAEIFCQTGNESMSQQEAEKIVDLMMRDEDLFYKTISLITDKRHLKNMQLSATLILPLISRACNDRSKRLNQLKDHVEEILGREMKIE